MACGPLSIVETARFLCKQLQHFRLPPLAENVHLCIFASQRCYCLKMPLSSNVVNSTVEIQFLTSSALIPLIMKSFPHFYQAYFFISVFIFMLNYLSFSYQLYIIFYIKKQSYFSGHVLKRAFLFFLLSWLASNFLVIVQKRWLSCLLQSLVLFISLGCLFFLKLND